MARVKVVAKTLAQLEAIANPERANQPEALPWVSYDSQQYVSGTTVTLEFFANTNADKTLSNMEAAGQYPHPQWFEIHYIGLDVLFDASASGAGADETGAIDDIAKLLFTGRGTWELFISQKRYGPFPVSFLHASGGPTGFLAATLTAPESIQYGNNGIFDGGFCVGGSIVIPPKTSFSYTLRWSAAQTLNAGNTQLRLWQHGVLHRRVL